MSDFTPMEVHGPELIKATALGLHDLNLSWPHLTVSTLLGAIDPDTNTQRRLVQCALDSLAKKRQSIEERRIGCVASTADRLRHDLIRFRMAEARLRNWLRTQDLKATSSDDSLSPPPTS